MPITITPQEGKRGITTTMTCDCGYTVQTVYPPDPDRPFNPGDREVAQIVAMQQFASGVCPECGKKATVRRATKT